VLEAPDARRSLPGPDHAASLEPGEFKSMCAAIRLVESALGDGVKKPAPCERKTLPVARRGVVAARDLERGRRLSAADLAVKRPVKGLPADELERVLGRVLRKSLRRDEPLTKACV
jgi:sialic acid synthase SpsE